MASNYSRQTSSHSAGDLVLAAHLDDELDYLYATVFNGGASTGIGTNDLMNDAVDGTKLADDACDSEHYTDGSIDTAHLSADCVTEAKLADNAVVDANIKKSGAFSLFGTRVTTDSTPATLIKNTTYKVETDGLVTVFTDVSSCEISIKTDSSSPPTTTLAAGKNGTWRETVSAWIIKGEYFYVTSSSGAPTIYWTPIGTGSCVKQ